VKEAKALINDQAGPVNPDKPSLIAIGSFISRKGKR